MPSFARSIPAFVDDKTKAGMKRSGMTDAKDKMKGEWSWSL